jgi:hypothetical protein
MHRKQEFAHRRNGFGERVIRNGRTVASIQNLYAPRGTPTSQPPHPDRLVRRQRA